MQLSYEWLEQLGWLDSWLLIPHNIKVEVIVVQRSSDNSSELYDELELVIKKSGFTVFRQTVNLVKMGYPLDDIPLAILKIARNTELVSDHKLIGYLIKFHKLAREDHK